MRVTTRARLKSCKVDMYGENNKLIRVIDDQKILNKNPVPQDEQFLFDFTADQIITCKRLFGVGYEELQKIPMNLPEEFLKALNEIAIKAAEHNIPFAPYEFMLRALYRETERIEGRINKVSGVDIKGVKKYSSLFKIDEKKNAVELTPAIQIMKALSNVKGNFYTQFSEIAAKDYGKDKLKVQKQHLLGYAAGHQEPTTWVLAAALDVLAQNNVNVLDLGVAREAVHAIWSRANPNRQDQFAEVLGVLNFKE